MTQETSNVILFKPKEPDEPKCSFCQSPKSKCKKLIANTDGRYHICDKCVGVATERLKDGNDPAPPDGRAA